MFSTDRRYEGTSYVAADHSTTPQNYAASGNGRVNILRRRISGGERIRTSIRDRTQRNPLSHPIYRAAQPARRCLGCNTGADDYHITLRMCNPRHTPFPVFAACTALPAVSDILSVTTRLCRFFATGTCSYDGTAASFPVPEGVFDATATSRTTANTGRRRTLQTQAVFNENTDRPR